jgi:hypothetical protein
MFTFNKDLPSAATAGRRVLVATQGFAALNIVTPDFIVPNGFLTTGSGTIDYAGVDQIGYSSLPTDGVTAINRNGAMILNMATNFAGQSGSVRAAPPAPATLDLNQHGFTGSWYQPETAGQGSEIEFFPNLVAPGTALVQGAWFTFDATTVGGVERQRWYTFSGNAQSGSTVVPITLFQNVDGNFDAPPITTSTAVGTGTLSFADCNHATLDYSFTDGTGRSGRVPLTRLTPNVTCVAGGTPGTNADYALSGNWFDATTDAQGLHVTSGQGFLFDIDPLSPVFFFAWYTYAASGQGLGAAGQRWFTGQQQPYVVGSRSFTVTLYETTGGLFNQVTNPAPNTVAVGSGTVTFTSCRTATFQYSFTGGSNAGKSRTIPLARIGPTPAGCVDNAMMMAYPYMP